METDKKKLDMEIEHAFEKLAESNYDVKLVLMVSDKESGATATSSLSKDILKEFPTLVSATMREADNERIERKINKMKRFKADLNMLEGGPAAAARKLVERLRKEGAKTAYVSSGLAPLFDSLEGFQSPKACGDYLEQRVAREIGAVDGIKLFLHGGLVWNDTTVLYE